jgi:quercetin dioxygenase-like cupin family protein
MGKFVRIALLTSVLMASGTLIAAQTQPPAPAQPKAAAASQHKLVLPDQVKWGQAPPALPPGAQMAVLDGDPTKPGLFTIRLKFADGWSVAPHWHPTSEHVVVLSGTFSVGVGDKADAANMHAMTTGSFAKMPARVRHYASAKGETTIQIYGTGPFVLNYVNPADDPRTKTGTK